MPITFNCECGKVLRVADENAGKRVKCPACSVVASAPAPEPMFEIVEPVATAKTKPVAKQADDSDDDDEDRGYGLAKGEDRAKKTPNYRRGSSNDDDDEDREAARALAKSNKKRPDPYAGPKTTTDELIERRGFSVSGSVAGGLFMMVLAVIIFVVRWQDGRVSIYAPILFIFGLIAFIKGLTGEE